jgi:hypothetical protein
LAAGAFYLSSASGQAGTSVSLGQNGGGETRRDASEARLPQRNRGYRSLPRVAIPCGVSLLTNSPPRGIGRRLRPLGAPPAPPAAPKPPAEAPPPPPAEPERPHLTLVGTVTGEPQTVAVVQDQATKILVRLRVGEAISGWFLRSIDTRSVTVEKNDEAVTVALPAPDSAAAKPAAVSETVQVGQKS